MGTYWLKLNTDFFDDEKIKYLATLENGDSIIVFWQKILLKCLKDGVDSKNIDKLKFTSDKSYTIELLAGLTNTPLQIAYKAFEEFQNLDMLTILKDGTYYIPMVKKMIGESSKERMRRYREKLSKHGGQEYLKLKDVIFERDEYKCIYCGSSKNLCIDHVIPVTLDGDNHQDNLATACKKCNSGKAGRTPELAKYTIISPVYSSIYEQNKIRISSRNDDVTVTVTNSYPTDIRNKNKNKDIDKDILLIANSAKQDGICADALVDGPSVNPKHKVPFNEILEMYHQILATDDSFYPKVQVLNEERKRKIKQRWMNELKTLEAWKTYFTEIFESNFLMGRITTKNGYIHKGTFDWIINSSNCLKVLEGNYSNYRKKQE